MSDTSKDTSTQSPVPWKWQYVFASVLLALFVVLVAVMLKNAKSADSTWKNMVYVFSSAEALVFTALGWVFGREVQRGAVQVAQHNAESSKKDAKEATQKEAAHRADAAGLRAAIRVATEPASTGPATPAPGGARDVGLGAAPTVAPPGLTPGLAALRALADEPPPA